MPQQHEALGKAIDKRVADILAQEKAKLGITGDTDFEWRLFESMNGIC